MHNYDSTLVNTRCINIYATLNQFGIHRLVCLQHMLSWPNLSLHTSAITTDENMDPVSANLDFFPSLHAKRCGMYADKIVVHIT